MGGFGGGFGCKWMNLRAGRWVGGSVGRWVGR